VGNLEVTDWSKESDHSEEQTPTVKISWKSEQYTEAFDEMIVLSRPIPQRFWLSESDLSSIEKSGLDKIFLGEESYRDYFALKKAFHFFYRPDK